MRGAFLEDLTWPEAGARIAAERRRRAAGRRGREGARAAPPAPDRLPRRPRAGAARGRGPAGARRAGRLVRLLSRVRPLPGKPAPPRRDVHGAPDRRPDGLRPPGRAPAGDHQHRRVDRGAAPGRRAGLLRGARPPGRGRRPGHARARRQAPAPAEARRPRGRARDVPRPRDRARRRPDGAGGARLRPSGRRPRGRLLPARRLRRGPGIRPRLEPDRRARRSLARDAGRPARRPSGRSPASWWRAWSRCIPTSADAPARPLGVRRLRRWSRARPASTERLASARHDRSGQPSVRRLSRRPLAAECGSTVPSLAASASGSVVAATPRDRPSAP